MSFLLHLRRNRKWKEDMQENRPPLPEGLILNLKSQYSVFFYLFVLFFWGFFNYSLGLLTSLITVYIVGYKSRPEDS